MNKPQTIAVIGSGAVGGYYGARLAEAGHGVTFLMRRDYEAVRSAGLSIASCDGDFKIPTPAIARNSEEIGPVDWVICALKATSIDEAERLVAPCVTGRTRILVLMNGFGLEERFAGWFGPERIFGGLAFACINRGEPGHIHHLAYGQITVGHYLDDPAELEAAVALWSGIRVRIASASSLLKGRWEKLCWNIPFNGLAVAAGGITADRIVNDPDLRTAARTLMEEVVAAGNADLEAHASEATIRPDIVDRMLSSTESMGAYRPSTMIDFVEGRPMEIEAIFAEPLRRARSLGVPTPQLALLTALLQRIGNREQGTGNREYVRGNGSV